MARDSTPPAAQTIAELQTAYTLSGQGLRFGAGVVDGTAYPEAPVQVPLAMLNRHGLVAGATGTGKTKTLQLMAEQLSEQGVPVFLADIKGDLSGLAAPGVGGERVAKRSEEIGDDWGAASYPVQFLSLGGVGTGVPVRASITSFGPQLLAKVLGLNDTQSSSLGLAFFWADKAGLPLLDLKDLRAVLAYLADEGRAELKEYGGMSAATAGVILRELVTLESQGAEAFFGEPEFDSLDLIATSGGKGVISCLELADLQDRPQLFSTFLMWLLADLFHDLPEVGDVDKPKLVFFFDEAHLLFHGASSAFLDAIAQTVRLIRSKGVGVFFVTQTPSDVPDAVLAQLGNRVQHALRAFTPNDAAALKATVSTFPRSEDYDLGELLPALGIGEAVITVLSDRGAPTPVAWTRLRAPRSLMAPIEAARVEELTQASPLFAEYAEVVDRDSAYERLAAKLAPPPAAAGEPAPTTDPARSPAPGTWAPDPGSAAPGPVQPEPAPAESGGIGGMLSGLLGSSAARSFGRSAATVAGREITRSLFGTSTRRRRRR